MNGIDRHAVPPGPTPGGDADGLPPVTPDAGRRPLPRFLMQVLWPAFLGAAVAVGVLFSLVDPLAVDAVHEHLGESRELACTVGFVGFWCLFSFACSLTWLLSATERRRDGHRRDRHRVGQDARDPAT